MSAGSFIGALAAGYISDAMGRRYALVVAAVIWIIGSTVSLSAQNVGHLIAGRVVNGLSGEYPYLPCVSGTRVLILPSWYYVFPSSCLPCRIVTQEHPWKGCWYPTVVDRMGYLDNVHDLIRMYLYRRPLRFQDRLGRPRNPRNSPYHRVVLFPRVSALVCVQGPLGGGARCPRPPSWKRRCHQPACPS